MPTTRWPDYCADEDPVDDGWFVLMELLDAQEEAEHGTP